MAPVSQASGLIRCWCGPCQACMGQSADSATVFAMENADVPARRRSWSVADVVAVAYLVFVLLYLPARDGGFTRRPLLIVALLGLFTLPLVWSEMAKVPRAGRWLAAAWGTGALASFALALDRSQFVDAMLVYALIPVIVFVTRRIGDRSWGPHVLAAVVGTSFVFSWYQGFLPWIGTTLSGQTPGQWMSLSWHNQSATLMLVGAVGAFGVAVLAQSLPVQVVSVALAGAGASAIWLSGSRGALLAAVGGVFVIVVASRSAWKRVVPVALAAAFTAGLLVVGLSVAAGDSGASGELGVRAPVAERTQSASGNVQWRIEHWKAVLGMFADEPLSGFGIGSYETVGSQFLADRIGGSSTAHNEFVEPLGEGGLLFGLPVLAALLAAVYAVLRSMFRGVSGPPFRSGVVLGAMGLTAALTFHAAIDFDWLYPLLAAHLAVAFAILSVAETTEEASELRAGPVGWLSGLFSVPLSLLLLVGVAGGLVEQRLLPAPAEYRAEGWIPWDSRTNRGQIVGLTEDGRFSDAEAVAAASLRWNPGDLDLMTYQALAKYLQGGADLESVLQTITPNQSRRSTYNAVANALIAEGSYEAAIVLLTPLTESDVESGQLGSATSADTWRILVTALGQQDGCVAVERLLSDNSDLVSGVDFEEVLARSCP